MQENITPSTAGAEGPDFFEYLKIVLRRKTMIVRMTIAGCVLSVIVALLWPKTYAAIARILPPQPEQSLVSLMMGQMGGGALSGLAGGVLGMGTPADQFASIMQSEQIKNAIIDRFKLMEEYGKEYRVDMHDKMDKIVTIKAGKKDGIITITVEDEDPRKAAAIANGYIDELGKLVAEMSMSGASLNRRFLEERLVRSKADLARAEEAMKAFLLRNKAVNVTEQAKASIEGVALLKAQLAAQEAQLSALRSQFTDTTPEVQSIKATVKNLNAQIAKLEGSGVGGAIPSVGSVPALGQEQLRLLREFKTQEMLVELLTKQYEITKLAEAKNINTIQVVQLAPVPDKKVRPKRFKIVLLGTMLSFLLSLAIVIIPESFARLDSEKKEKFRLLKDLLRNSGQISG